MFLRSKIQEVMMRERSRAVGGKHGGFMSDAISVTSPTAASLLSSPRLFEASFSAKAYAEYEAVVSPTSTLETQHFSARGNSFFPDRGTRKQPLPSESTPAGADEINVEPRAVGLGLLDALADEGSGKMLSRTECRMVVFGPQLNVQIPPVAPCTTSPAGSLESPRSPIEFGIKTKDSLLALNSPAWRPPADACMEASSPRAFVRRNISPSDVELSEDYTCVIVHGPNPRTIHIFDDCIIESSGDGCISSVEEKRCSDEQYHSDCDGYELLGFCSACKRKLGPNEDVFMYRGEKTFCSQECRCQEMLFDAVVE